MKLSELSVRAFSAEVASASPAPGGGSVSAAIGSMAASLTSMVCGLTIGHKNYKATQELVILSKKQADSVAQQLLELMERDTEAFLLVSSAYTMPRETPEEKVLRSNAIQHALKACTEVPFAVMQTCVDGLALVGKLIGNVNASAASDLGVAASSYKTAAQGAWLNVLINISSIKDEAFSKEYYSSGEKILQQSVEMADRYYEELKILCSK